MKLLRSLVWTLPLSLGSSLSSTALATTLELNVLPTPASEGPCPQQLIAHETLRPYVEGSYSRDGMIRLSDIATKIQLIASDTFSATWVGTLQPEYQTCQGSAIINRIDTAPYEGHSYLQIQLADGQVEVTLDMTGIPDANGFTSTLLFSGIRDGNPRWTWGGTD